MATYPLPADPVSALTRAAGTTEAHSTDHGRVIGIWENVKHYGAYGDGSHDDTTAIQAAIDAAHTNGTHVVYFPPGTYVVSGLIVYANTRLVGAGRKAVTLKLKAGSTTNVITGTNYATLIAKGYAVGDYLLGAYDAHIENLTIDGNKANCPSGGYGIAIWGKGLQFHNLQVQSCKGHGIHTQFTTHDDGAIGAEPGGHFSDLTITANDGDGWLFRGPHDSKIQHFTTYNNGGWGLYSDYSSGTPYYNGTINGFAWNSWLNSDSFYFNGTTGDFNTIAATGVGGTGIEIATGSGAGKFVNVVISGHDTGLILNGSNHMISAFIRSCGTGVELGSASINTLTVSAVDCDTVVDFVGGELGENILNIAASIGSGDLFVGTPHTSDIITTSYVDGSIARGWQRLATLPTTSLPDTDTVFEGVTLWDSTLHQPVWFDGTRWQYTRATTETTVADGVALPDGKGGLGRFENLLIYSEQFDNAAWAKDHGSGTAPSVTANTQTAPTGSGSTADTYTTGSVGGSSNALVQTVTGLGAIGDRTFTVSCYVKGSAGTNGLTCAMRVDDGVSDNTSGAVTGTVVLSSSAWQRVSSTYTFASGNAGTSVRVVLYITTGASVDTYFWGAQLTETEGAAIYTQSVGTAVSATTGLTLTVDKGLFGGGIGVGNSAAGSTPGTCVKKIQVFDATGASLGYLPVYDAIT